MLWLTATVTTCTWVFVFPVVLLLSQYIGFLRDASQSRKLAVASLAATLGCANACTRHQPAAPPQLQRCPGGSARR